MNGVPPYPPAAPGRPDDRKAIAIVIVVVCAAAVVALAFVFLAGAVRFGTPRATGIVTSAGINDRNRPTSKQNSFDARVPRVYCCTRVRAFQDTVLEARWFLGPAQVGGFSGTFGAMTRTSTGKFLTSAGDVAFSLRKPPTGWSGGDYTVQIYVNGKLSGSTRFTVRVEGQAVTTSTYSDPQGRFKVDVPNGWLEADSTTFDNALVGFIGAGSSYAPRFAVTQTGFASADPGTLNSDPGAAQGSAQFQPYSLGSTPAARRDFEWDYGSGGKTLKLHTVQVVVQGNETVYGIDCHSLASDYNKNLPTFNVIINSFRLVE